jgi:protein-L-isoaspartate(D-aspartate) O-methyltransferase
MSFISDALKVCRSLHLTVPNLVINAMKNIDRQNFMVEKYRNKAYKDEPFPIPEGQTISAPHMVMMMLSEELFGKLGDYELLEIGTGSGYNAAVLSQIFNKITSIERNPKLLDLAKSNLHIQGIRNVELLLGDGTSLELDRKFHRIMVTAAAPYIPDALIKLLHPRGILLIPVQNTYSQTLVRLDNFPGKCHFLKSGSQYLELVSCSSGPSVRFVPLLGEDGY